MISALKLMDYALKLIGFVLKMVNLGLAQANGNSSVSLPRNEAGSSSSSPSARIMCVLHTKMMNSAFKMIGFVFKMMNSAFKMIGFVFKMIGFVELLGRRRRGT